MNASTATHLPFACAVLALALVVDVAYDWVKARTTERTRRQPWHNHKEQP